MCKSLVWCYAKHCITCDYNSVSQFPLVLWTSFIYCTCIDFNGYLNFYGLLKANRVRLVLSSTSNDSCWYFMYMYLFIEARNVSSTLEVLHCNTEDAAVYKMHVVCLFHHYWWFSRFAIHVYSIVIYWLLRIITD